MSDADLESYTKRDFSKMSDAGLAVVAAGRGNPTAGAAPSVSGQAQAGGGIPTPTGAGANVSGSRGGYRRRATDENGDPSQVPFSEWAGNAATAALHSPVTMAHGFAQAMGANVDPETIKADRALTDVPGGSFGDFAGGAVAGGGAGGAVLKGLRTGIKFLPKALQAYAKFASVPAAAGTTEALTTTTLDDESRFDKSLGAAALAGGFQALGAGGRRMLTGFTKPNADAEALRKLGIQVNASTGGTGLSSKFLTLAENLGDLGENSKRFARSEREAMTTAGDKAQMLRVEHIPVNRGNTIDDFWPATLAENDAAYTGLLGGKRMTIPPLIKQGLTADIRAAMPHNESGSGPVISKVMDIMNSVRGTVSGTDWQKARTAVNDELRKAEGNATSVRDEQVVAAFKTVRDRLNNIGQKHMTADEWAKLGEYDNKYAHQMVLQDATGIPHKEQLTPFRNLYQAAESSANPAQKSSGTGMFMDITEPGKRTLNVKEPASALERRLKYGTAGAAMGSSGLINPLLYAALPITYGIGKLSASRSGSEFLMGQKQWQPAMAEALRKMNGYGAIAAQQGLMQPAEGEQYE